MLPFDPAEIEHLLAATSTAAGAAGATGLRALRWRDWRGKRSAQHKQARALYLEVLGNLLLCRIGLGTHPPQLIVASREWRRPGTLGLLAELHAAGELARHAPPQRLALGPHRHPAGRPLRARWVAARLPARPAKARRQLIDPGRLFSPPAHRCEDGATDGCRSPVRLPALGWPLFVRTDDRRRPAAVGVGATRPVTEGPLDVDDQVVNHEHRPHQTSPDPPTDDGWSHHETRSSPLAGHRHQSRGIVTNRGAFASLMRTQVS